MDGMRLRNFHLGFALGTTQDLAFLDFAFIHIDFGGTFRATDHGSILRRVVRAGAGPHRVHHRAAYYIPQPQKSTPGRAGTALNATAPEDRGPANVRIPRVPRKAHGWHRRRDYRSRPHAVDSPRQRASARRVV